MKQLIIALTVMIAVFSAQAEVVFSEDYESAAVGSDITSLNDGSENVWTGGQVTKYLIKDETTSDAFSPGAENQYLELNNDNTEGTKATFSFATSTSPAAILPVSTISFDVYIDSSSWTDASYLRVVSVGDVAGDVKTKTNLVYADIGFEAGLNDGVDFELDKVWHIDIVSNLSNEDVTYGANSIADNKMDVFVNGVNTIDDQSLNLGGEENSTGVTGLGLWLASGIGDNTQINIDNLEFRNEAIPEPATIGLLGLGALMTLLVRRVKRA